jgi:hypothetical protein
MARSYLVPWFGDTAMLIMTGEDLTPTIEVLPQKAAARVVSATRLDLGEFAELILLAAGAGLLARFDKVE